MAAQDNSEELNSNVENGSERMNQENNSHWNENVVRVRKPYIVTKQRERWSEEEHEKFLEAIKLYGRGWSKIEEHIGTKTAVQIRSHAQKFFNKVAREANNSSEELVIPPPRPKRKPDHPYPRKSPVPYSSNLSAMEKGSRSPTSVLSAFASDDQMNNRSSSPNSCISDFQSIGGKNDYATSKQSFKEDAAAGSRPISSITLFGKLVLVSESHRQSYYRDDHKSMTVQENHNLGIKKSNLHIDSGHVETDLSLGVCETSCTGSNVFGSLEKQESCYPENGFRPYKRCLSEREVTSSLLLVTTEEHRSQKARVCS